MPPSIAHFGAKQRACVLQVKFPERTLKFKVATGGKDEREQWVGALHAARKQHEAAQQARNSAAGKLEHLQKVCSPDAVWLALQQVAVVAKVMQPQQG